MYIFIISVCLFVYSRVQWIRWYQIKFHDVDNVNITKLFMDCNSCPQSRWVLHTTGCFFILRFYFMYVCLYYSARAWVDMINWFLLYFLSLRQTWLRRGVIAWPYLIYIQFLMHVISNPAMFFSFVVTLTDSLKVGHPSTNEYFYEKGRGQ